MKDITGADLMFNAVMNGGVAVVDPRGIRDLSPDLLDAHGRLQLMPASYYAKTTNQERAFFGNRHGAYVLPTIELIEYLRERIGGRSAIEVGSGNGLVAEALGIPATDSHQQTEPAVERAYREAGQAPIRYGSNVEKLDALSAVRKYRPQVVLACWVTHRWNPQDTERGGNVDGVDERELLSLCDEYLFLGYRKVHSQKPIMSMSHRTESPMGLYSRALLPDQDFVAAWTREP